MNSAKNLSKNKDSKIALFEQKEIRRIWQDGKWFFSIVDVVGALTNQPTARSSSNYWAKLKERLKDEGADELLTNCQQLKMPAADGKNRLTDVADTTGVLRIIESVPSKKAEPFKRWLARVGAERIEEIRDPELAAKRMRSLYEAKGYPKDWIDQRERGIATRQRLTREWRDRGADEGRDFAILTNEIYKTGFGFTAKEYKDFKNISEDQNLRDSMTNLELALTNLGETTATELHKQNNSYGMQELTSDTHQAGEVTNEARKSVEARLGRPAVSSADYLDLSRNDDLLSSPDLPSLDQ